MPYLILSIENMLIWDWHCNRGLSCCLQSWQHKWVPVWVLVVPLLTQLPANRPGKASDESSTWALLPMWETQEDFQVSDSYLASPNHCDHLGNEPAGGIPPKRQQLSIQLLGPCHQPGRLQLNRVPSSLLWPGLIGCWGHLKTGQWMEISVFLS